MATARATLRLVTEAGHLVGEDHPNAKLNWADVELMRQLHDDGLTVAEISRKFEQPWSTVRDVCRYLTWTELPVRKARHMPRLAGVSPD
ncbi:MAG: hypothetical protein AB7P16_28435 [Bradyrhizobium sp.]|uniref:hypothetical protein n=1 Tax=Bradyrhizobium sp. TaxID=376 RepID=UPI003D0AB74C